MVYRKDISENRPGLVEGEENEAKVVYRHENQYDPNCVRLYKLHEPMSSRLLILDASTKTICYVPAGIPAGHLDTINLAPQLLISASRLKYQGTKPIILCGSLLRQDCMTQGLTSSWSWRLLDTAVQKVFILTKGHLKPSVHKCRTYLVQRGCAFNTPFRTTSIL